MAFPGGAELAALADVAGVAVEDLALLNFRGDLGHVEGSFDCSDLAWRRERSFIAHNEDQGASMIGRCVLLTLAIDGLPPVCAFWCPMFLPSNAFWVTDGLVLSVDSLTVPHKTGATDQVRTECALFPLQSRVVACVLTKENADQRWLIDNEAQVTMAKMGRAIVEAWPRKPETKS